MRTREAIESSDARDRFYDELESFTDFDKFADPRHFVPVPLDWYVVITDVEGSTRAIEAGHYKDVNTIGAASISVVQEELHREVPYVFGGDGATLLVPEGCLKNALSALGGLKRLAREKFGIELRVGCVAVREVVGGGITIEAAKYELVPGRSIAVFRGGGLSEAERRIKSGAVGDGAPEETNDVSELKGLSCRWNAIPTKHGCVLSLLALARDTAGAGVYDALIEELRDVFGGRMDDANPVNTDAMEYKSLGKIFADERRYHASVWSFRFVLRLAEILAAVAVFRMGVPRFVFNPERYCAAMRVHSDFRKFDDMLRMIVDCSTDQAERIREYLEGEREAGKLFYGLHRSDTALMTCYVQDMRDGGHIHFIDGGDGGYAMAAKQMKGQMKSAGRLIG